MRPKTPRRIKEDAIRLWIQGLKRHEIAKKIGIGDGTVSAIIMEAREQKEYYEIDMLRQISRTLREERLEPSLLGFAIRVRNLMKENNINEDQLEIVMSDIAAYCFKNDLSYETLIECGTKAKELTEQYGINVELLSDYLAQAKAKLESSEQQSGEILNGIVIAQNDLDIILAELERYGGEKQLIEQMREMKKDLEEARLSEAYYKQRFQNSERRWQLESSLASKMYNENLDLNHKLVECQKMLDRAKD